jgi:hypothetical protein
VAVTLLTEAVNGCAGVMDAVVKGMGAAVEGILMTSILNLGTQWNKSEK